MKNLLPTREVENRFQVVYVNKRYRFSTVAAAVEHAQNVLSRYGAEGTMLAVVRLEAVVERAPIPTVTTILVDKVINKRKGRKHEASS